MSIYEAVVVGAHPYSIEDAKYGAALTRPRIHTSLELLLVSRLNAVGHSRFAPFDPVWSQPLRGARQYERVISKNGKLSQVDILQCCRNTRATDGYPECHWLSEEACVFIAKCLKLFLCQLFNGLESSSALGYTSAFLQELLIDDVDELFFLSEVGHILLKLFQSEIVKRVFDAGMNAVSKVTSLGSE